jgi:hypothetical protein
MGLGSFRLGGNLYSLTMHLRPSAMAAGPVAPTVLERIGDPMRLDEIAI